MLKHKYPHFNPEVHTIVSMAEPFTHINFFNLDSFKKLFLNQGFFIFESFEKKGRHYLLKDKKLYVFDRLKNIKKLQNL